MEKILAVRDMGVLVVKAIFGDTNAQWFLLHIGFNLNALVESKLPKRTVNGGKKQ